MLSLSYVKYDLCYWPHHFRFLMGGVRDFEIV